jgi:Glycosyltransferase family 87/Uncharacterized protein conserved in bacteria (DUF2062)
MTLKFVKSRIQMRTMVAYAAMLLGFAWLVLIAARQHHKGNDYITFGTLWASGHAAFQHTDPFAAYPETYVAHFHGDTIPDLNLNPPWTLPVLQILARWPLEQFTVVWCLLTGACLIVGCLILISNAQRIEGWKVGWFLLSYPTLATVLAGQVYGWAFLACALAWLFERQRRHIATGIAVGVAVALRPTMILWVALLYIAGYRKTAASSLVTISVLFTAPLLLYGPTIYGEWLRAFAGDQHWLSTLR